MLPSGALPSNYGKARYTLATKLNSTRLTLLKVNKVDRVAVAPYTPVTKSIISATKLNCIDNKVDRIGDSRLCCRFVAGFGNSRLCCQCVPGLIQQPERCNHQGYIMCVYQILEVLLQFISSDPETLGIPRIHSVA